MRISSNFFILESSFKGFFLNEILKDLKTLLIIEADSTGNFPIAVSAVYKPSTPSIGYYNVVYFGSIWEWILNH